MTKRGARTSRPTRRPSSIAIKRGVHILIDRLWPRSVSKTELKLDAWPRELAPSTELRKWYSHDPVRFAEFRRRYKAELAQRPEQLSALRAMVKGRAATLITATRELDLSHAEVMRSILQQKRTSR